MRRALLPFAALAFALGGPAGAATIRVPADQPTVFAAVAASAPDDTVLVAPGVYDEGQWVPAHDGVDFVGARFEHPLTLRSEGGPEVTTLELNGVPESAQRPTLLQARQVGGRVTIEGFTLRGSSFVSALLVRDVDELVFRNNRVRGFWGGEGVALNVATGSSALPAVFEDCVVEDCGATYGMACVLYDEVSLFRCTFRRCENPLAISAPAEIRVCRFEENEGQILVLLPDEGEEARIEDTVFLRNLVRGFGNELVYARYTDIARCQFLENAGIGQSSRPVVTLWEGSCTGSYFRGNVCDYHYWDIVASMHDSAFRRNVIVGNRGGNTVGVSEPGLASCNFFWDNEDDDVTSDEGWEVDPQFCDPVARDLAVMSTSPLLEINSEGCGAFPLFFEGCATRGGVVKTEPPFQRVMVDAVEQTAPVYREWQAGIVHTLEGLETQPIVAGERYVFDDWSDGGDRVHDIAPTGPGWEATASHHREIRLITGVSGGVGGTVDPPTGWYLPGTPVQVTATPDVPFLFLEWTGTGYNGPDPVITLILDVPHSQTAHFTRYWPCFLGTTAPGARLLADGLEFEAPHTFQWLQGTQHLVQALDPVEAGAGIRLRFEGWANWWRNDPVRPITVYSGGFADVAEYRTEYLVDLEATGSGQALPEDSWVDSGGSFLIDAVADSGWQFVEWIGAGEGSYSGPERNVALTVGGPIMQTAVFEPEPVRVAAVVLSLSATDPDVAVGSAPLGVGEVHLWLLCEDDDGLETFSGRLTGGMTVISFNPAPGVTAGGPPSEPQIVTPGCPAGPFRLGAFAVFDPDGGAVCLEPNSQGILGGTGCSATPVTYAWPTTLRIRGVATDGTTPCESGNGCGGGRVLQPSGSLVFTDEFHGARPNPFLGSTTLEFALSGGGPARLDVYDVTGRLVRRLAEGPRAAGEHRVTWDRRDGRGARMPAGVYFVRLTAVGFAQTRKVLVLD